MTLVGNTLYGTTYYGGRSNLGVVFKLNTDGTGFEVVKHFAGNDGAHPDTELVLHEDALYGATTRGGAWDLGTIYKLDLAGSPMPVFLTARLIDGAVVLSWTNPAFVLQSAHAPFGPFNNVPGATSPHVIPRNAQQQFFRRLKQ